MKKIGLVLLCIAMCLASCTNKKAHIRGTITGADGEMLYLENVGLDGIEAVDSAKLSADGTFAFALPACDAPEFYRLRIGQAIVNVAVDSTQTITLKAKYPGMAQNYEVEGSEDCARMKELALLQTQLQVNVNAIINDPTLKMYAVEDSLNSVIGAYKDYVKNEYLYKEPQKASSYFALFQTVTIAGSTSLIFNPRADENDVKAFAAVGTSWDTFHPGSVRGENLHNIVIESMKNIRILQAQRSQTIDPSKIDTSNVIDIALPDRSGNVRRLSELKGNVVLLDFCSFAQDGTAKRIMALREVYNKYHARGLEIYQVSVDANEHFWMTQTAALPWVSVNDASSLSSNYLMLYNVQKLPTYFLLDRNCSPSKRDEQIEDINKEIEALL